VYHLTLGLCHGKPGQDTWSEHTGGLGGCYLPISMEVVQYLRIHLELLVYTGSVVALGRDVNGSLSLSEKGLNNQVNRIIKAVAINQLFSLPLVVQWVQRPSSQGDTYW
jgi:NAD/NADP transhydrogenase beta subunit